VDPEKNDASLNQRGLALERDLPEVLVERQEDSALGIGQIRQVGICYPGEVRSCLKDVVTGFAQRINNRLREVLVREESHRDA